VRVIEQDALDFSEAVPHVLRHPQTEHSLNLSVIECGMECRYGRYPQLFINSENAPRIKTGIRTQLDELCGRTGA